MKHHLALGLLLTLGACSVSTTPDPSTRLQSLFDEEWEFRLQESPLLATSVGDHRFGERLPDASLAAEQRRYEARLEFLERLGQIDRALLDSEDRVSALMFEAQLQDSVKDFELGGHLIPFTSDSGFHTDLARLPTQVPLDTVADYQNYLSRLAAIPGYFDGYLEVLQQAVKEERTLPRVVLEGFEHTMASHVVEDAQESLFFAPFKKFPPGIPEDRQEELRTSGRQAVLEHVVPAYQKLLSFMEQTYIPTARNTLGASALPQGEQYYAHLIRRYTTLDLSADEIHELGLQEVDRIHQEMNQVIEQVGFDGSFDEFLLFLRTDPRFYAKTPEDLLKEASFISKKMDARLPALFGHLPRLPYGVEPVPAHIAPKYTAGRYVSPARGSRQPGLYWVNTYDLESRPLYALEALSLHEAVPGHHLQGSIARELEGLPPFRRFTYLSAYGEGWGLYSERLGLEAGFYTDPYSNFGRLTYEMWRACRLVVDTGLHAKGWSREQAMDYLASRTALSLLEVRTETDRYISWPGQALAYKIGELKIRELRSKAEKTLGGAFDLREFHDAVLGSGSVPLPVLEEIVDGYIERRRSASP
ncbi:MAG: DUF885 domain-containing protein [Deltaproteobacteria bacterium]|nr:DUF885 domain-containing protein [Deltaproteobacteria bacterium]